MLSLAAGLSAAALVAVGAILTHSFDRTDLRLVGTSLGFSMFSALAAAGASARTRNAGAALGTCTVLAAAAGFALLLAGLWLDAAAGVWRAFGAVTVATLAGSHACLVWRARRAHDSQLIAALANISVASAAVDSALGIIAITGITDQIDAGFVRLLAVLVVVMLLTTALPPILRRVPSRSADPAPTSPGIRPHTASALTQAGQSAELLAIARRLDELVPNAGELAPHIQQQAAHLRRVAHTPR
jgi:hypothetical protein